MAFSSYSLATISNTLFEHYRRSAFAALSGRLCYDCTLQTERESKRWLSIFRAKN